MDKAAPILEFVKDELDDEDHEVGLDTSLFRDRLLDSMTLTSLVTFLEDEFSIRVAAMDIVFENFDTVRHMVAFIERKQAGG